ncbi:hypothetical protein CLPU_15c00690 [Gottschalkia purinilytica]|uniref:Uncharacterized protein n=1 Tax=Gottschalkia purinilytica TaxID=1503 RepID=A0A0L0W8H5_GOTPU|nr:hypothetical protein [Gottschalkia purinilytica]KNF07575.1 hypothetical protein CLPU_15c00690 [Gottschalkia purinilytica]
MRKILSFVITIIMTMQIGSYSYANENYECSDGRPKSYPSKISPYANGRPTSYPNDHPLYTWGAAPYQALKGSRPFMNSNVRNNLGSYYYMYTGNSTTYSQAHGTVNLKKINFDNKNLRNAYISFGIYGHNESTLDFGLINTGSGWKGYYYVPKLGAEKDWWEDSEGVNNADSVTFDIGFHPTNQDIVTGYFEFKDAAGKVIKKVYKEVNVSGVFQKKDGKPVCGFYRFVSLIPKHGVLDNNKDGSYLTNIDFSALQLYNTVEKKYNNWNMRTGIVEQAFIVKPDNISFATYPYTGLGIVDSTSISYR